MSIFSQASKRAYVFYFCFAAAIIFGLFFLRAVMIPLALAFILAYILNPLIEWLDRKHIPRGWVSFSVLLIANIIIFFAAWILVPIVYAQLEVIMAQLPQFKNYIETQWLPHVDRFLSRLAGKANTPLNIVKFADIVPPLLEKPHEVFKNVFSHLGQSTRFAMSVLLTLVLSPVMAFFVMRDFKKLMAKSMEFVPPDLRSSLYYYVKEVDKTLRGILRGQVIVVSLLMVLYSAAFFIVGLPAALAVGVVTGLARFVPYLDIFVGGTLCFFILSTTAPSTTMIVGVVVAFLTIQMLDGAFLTPRIMGRYSGIHPFVIIILIVCMGDWLGIVGVLFAVPLAAIGRISFLTFAKLYRDSRFFTRPIRYVAEKAPEDSPDLLPNGKNL